MTFSHKLYTILGLLAGTILLGFLVIYVHHISKPDVSLSISSAQFISSNSATNPFLTSKSYSTVSLPDDWHHSKTPTNQGWYKIDIPLKVAPDRLWGIYIPSVHMNAEIYLNDELIGNAGKFTDPVARNWNRPLYFSIPNGMLIPGNNTILLRIKSDSNVNGLLSSIYIGSEEYLKPVYEWRYFLRYTISQIIFFILITTSFFMTVLWWLRKKESIYGWFSLAIFEWAIHNLNYIVINIPVSGFTWNWFSFVTMMWFSVLASSFVQRFTGNINYKIEKIFYIYATIISILLLIIADQNSIYIYGPKIADGSALLIGLYPIYNLFKYYQQHQKLEAYILMMSGILLIIFGTHDALVMNYVIRRTDGIFLPYSAFLALIAFAYILLKKFTHALSEVETLNSELEERIQQKHSELEENYTKMRKLENKQVLLSERERIMQDMHDGIGGHLVSSISMIDSGTSDPSLLRGSLQFALDDLRLIIDSMEDTNGDLTSVLGMLRQRIEPRISAAGIKLIWKIKPIPSLSNFGPEKTLQVLRILQESITNTIKHANATEITLTTDTDHNGHITIICEDNGSGFEADSDSSGYGISNMEKRADKIDARLEIISDHKIGTKTVIYLVEN